MPRFNQPLQGKAPRQPKRIRPAFYGCLIGVGISQFFYSHVRPDNVGPTSGSSFVPAVIESCDRGAFSLGFAKRSGLDRASIGQLEEKARNAIERAAGRDLEGREWIQMKAKLTEFCTILQDWQKQALTDRKVKKL